MKQKFIKIVFFCAIIIMCGVCLVNVLGFKYVDGILPMENFYKERPKTIDVICLGSSHTFFNISTKTLWEEFGIASYDLAGSVQPFWNSYYFLKEAILYQQPKLVILDVYRAIEDREYVDHSRVIKNTFGISSAENRISAIWKSAPKSQRLHYWLAYPTYHQRYMEISRADFLRDDNNLLTYSKGFALMMKTTAYATPQLATSIASSPLSAKTEEYLLKIIKLCQEHHVPLLLCVTPYAGDNIKEEAIYAAVQDIARAHDVSYINFNHHYTQIGLDFSCDAGDTAHLNYKGAEKFSRYLGQYIKKHYDVPDRRGEVGWESYENMRQMFQWRIENHEMAEIKEISAFLDKLVEQKDRYLLVVGLQGNYQTIAKNSLICAKLETLGVSIKSAKQNDVWVIDAGKRVFHAGAKKPFDWHMLMNPGFVRVSCDGGNGLIKCNINREEEIFLPQGLSIVVYDRMDYYPTISHIIDRAGFSTKGGKVSLKQPLQKKAT